MLVTGLVLRIVDTSGASRYMYDKHSEVRACVHVRSAQKAPHEEMASPVNNGLVPITCSEALLTHGTIHVPPSVTPLPYPYTRGGGGGGGGTICTLIHNLEIMWTTTLGAYPYHPRSPPLPPMGAYPYHPGGLPLPP